MLSVKPREKNTIKVLKDLEVSDVWDLVVEVGYIVGVPKSCRVKVSSRIALRVVS
jgi:hypothetical protein